MDKYIEVLSWSFGSSQPGTFGEPDFTGEITFDGFDFTFQDAPNPAVGIALGPMFGDQFASITLEGATLDYGDDGEGLEFTRRSWHGSLRSCDVC